MVIKNKNIRGCRICQNKLISNVVDPIIYKAEMSDKDLAEKLQTQYGYMVELTEIKAHSRHIFNNDINYNDLETKELVRINTVKTIDLVKEEIARLNVQELQMIEEGKENTLEYNKLVKLKMEYITAKGKIEGEITDTNITVPDWLSRLEDRNDKKQQ